MTSQEALAIHAQFVKLSKQVAARMPKTVERPDYRERYEDKDTYDLYEIDLEDLIARYRLYIGCGDYEYTSEHINLKTLFPEQ